MTRHIGVRVGAIPGAPRTAGAADTVGLTDSVTPTLTPATIEGTIPGWLKTASNTGLAGVGVTTNDLTALSLSNWNGTTANITGTYTRRRLTLSTTLAPGNNTTFTECLIEGSRGALVQVSGSNVQFINCDFVQTGTGGFERVHLNANPYYGAGDGLVMRGCKMQGGTIFINATWVDATIEDCYGFGQDPNNNGGVEHRDGFTCRGGDGPTVLRRNRFVCDQGATTGALFLQNTFGDGVANMTFEQNMFEGTGYCATLEGSLNLRFTDNRFHSYAANGGAGYGPATSSGCTFTTWSGNYTYAATPPNYQGSLLSQP
jgi:hypothetical protein